MAVILADTDVLIDFLAGVEPVATQVANYLDSDLLKTTAVNCFELLSGATDGRRGDAVRQLVSALEVLPLDLAGAGVAARVRRELEDLGLKIGMGDSLIAGIALANDCALFSRNRKQFERVAGLTLVELP